MRDPHLHDVVLHRDPASLPPDATVRDACATMRERGIGSILVAGADGRLLGIFTGRDAVCRVLAEGRDPSRLTLAEAMTPNPATLTPDAGAIDALRLMQDGGFRHVPVVADTGRCVGVVSRGDFRALHHARLVEETRIFEVLR
jgi:CBS domain-containing protein